MGTVTTPTPSPEKLSAALTRYRVMAWVTGSFLLLLTLEVVVKYGVKGGEPWLGTWVAVTHGWIYVVYLVTVVNLWSTLRWRTARLLMLVLAGVVPGLSFVAERLVTREVRARIAALPAAGRPGSTLAR
jgi:integral membrane protein